MTDNTPEHRRERRRWTPTVLSGHAMCAERICLMPSRWLDPTQPWDLAHDHQHGGYLGPAHPKCNRAEGGRRRHAPTPIRREIL